MGPSQFKSQAISMNHPNFKNVEIITHEQTPYMKARFVIHNTKNFEDWENTQKITDKMDGTYLLLPVDHKIEKNAFCGPSAVVNILYENYPIILADEIENRRNYEQHFHQTEVWYLLHILISNTTLFHSQLTKLGDIRPQNIFINRQGQIKLANVFSWPNLENNYFKSLTQNEITYLAPQQLLELAQKRPTPQSDPYKGESFSIGLTLLGVMLLEDCSKLYDPNDCTFDSKSLQNLLGRLNAQKLYSWFLRKIVTSMLDINPQTRKSSKQVYELIKPYQYQMENLIQFEYQQPIQESQVTSHIGINSNFRPSFQHQNNVPYYQRPSNLTPQLKYNYTSNLPPTSNSPQKSKLGYVEQNYYTSDVGYKNTVTESQKVNAPLPNIDTTNKFQLPNYTSNTYTNFQSTSNYTPKTLQEIYSSIGIKENSIGSKLNNLNSSPISPNKNQPNLSYSAQKQSSFAFTKNYDLLKPSQPINLSSNSGSKTPAIPWQEVDKYIQMSKQMYK